MKISGLGLEGVVHLEQIPAKLARRVQNWFSSGQFSRWQGRRNLLEIGGVNGGESQMVLQWVGAFDEHL